MDPMETTSTPTVPSVPTPPPTEPAPPPSHTQQVVPPPLTVSSSTEIPISISSQNAKPNTIHTQHNSSNQNPQSSTTPIQQQQQPHQQPTLQQAQTRPQLNRVQPPLPYSQYSQHLSSFPPPSTSTSLSSSATTTSIQRGGLAIGVPAHQQRPPSQPAPFSTYGQSPFSQQYGGVGRNPINISDMSNTQVRQPIQGMQTIGNFGSLVGSQVRPGGAPSQNQPKALQPSMRPHTTPTNHTLPNQPFQSHALLRNPAMGSPSTTSPTTPQALQTHTQPWMTAGTQGKPMHPSYRPPIRPQNLQQRSHQPQQHHHPVSTVTQQATYSQQQQPMSQLHKPQDHYGPQHTLTRVPQSISHQQQAQRGLGSGNPNTAATTSQASVLKSAPPNTASDMDAGESSNHILSKRSIHELVSQIDPSEELDPEVEDILIEIAEDFVDSITSVGCSLAKHRKSTTLEAKDILLHLERNWNMTLPGFGGDEIKGYKKQLTNDIHKERLAMVKKSMVGPDMVNVKSSGGQAAGNLKARENA